MTVTVEQVHTLSRHLLNERLILGALNRHWSDNPDPNRQPAGDPDDPEFFAWVSMWYSTLYVVWEGCRDYGVRVDLPYEDVEDWATELRRFRNKTFHVEPPFPHQHLLDYIRREESVTFGYVLGSMLGLAIHREAERLGMERDALGIYR